MTFYIRCSRCNYQEKKEGDSIGGFQCPKCQGRTFDMKSGTPPSWWIDAPQFAEEPAKELPADNTFRVQFSPIDPFFIVGAIYLSSTESLWWLMVIPWIVGSWFFNPRWNRDEGWRLYHDRT